MTLKPHLTNVFKSTYFAPEPPHILPPVGYRINERWWQEWWIKRSAKNIQLSWSDAFIASLSLPLMEVCLKNRWNESICRKDSVDGARKKLCQWHENSFPPFFPISSIQTWSCENKIQKTRTRINPDTGIWGGKKSKLYRLGSGSSCISTTGTLGVDMGFSEHVSQNHNFHRQTRWKQRERKVHEYFLPVIPTCCLRQRYQPH